MARYLAGFGPDIRQGFAIGFVAVKVVVVDKINHGIAGYLALALVFGLVAVGNTFAGYIKAKRGFGIDTTGSLTGVTAQRATATEREH